MTDQPSVPSGKGKALAAGGITFASVLIAVLLREHYQDTFKAVEDAGYPLPFIIASVAGILAHLITFWTSADITDIIIGWIKSLKRILYAWQQPPSP